MNIDKIIINENMVYPIILCDLYNKTRGAAMIINSIYAAISDIHGKHALVSVIIFLNKNHNWYRYPGQSPPTLILQMLSKGSAVKIVTNE